uniref:Uncharacterized protein AlNc14C46G3752 n=1 Tax=Albugo laibachii Nc14 TaxID=890382 RepID=F0WAN8_9STRA|nr:conserved hypothetical protein [Albugo laibachii Nc14]|eukprot:CCA18209.1 conserved hypothetical protein [Albugo laibachii Nc14]
MKCLAPPPQLAYATLEQAKAAIDDHAQQEGYVVVVKRTKKVGDRKDGDMKALILAFSQSNPPAIREGPRRRVSSSGSTGCLFKASIRRQESGDWQVQNANEKHKHEPFSHQSAHTRGRALTEESQQAFLMLGRAGVTPCRIITSLRQNNNVMATAQDIDNLLRAILNRMLAGRSPLIALLDGLAPDDYFSHFNVLQQLTDLLIISPSAKAICNKYSAGCVWLIDATYKTNKYGLPPIHIIGVTATKSTYIFADCFMRNETLADYLWAMRHVKEVFQGYGLQHAVLTFFTDQELALMSALSDTFPNASFLLCRWHINKNILAKQRTAFQTSEAWQEFNQTWNELVAATTMAEFETQLAVMHDRFSAASMSYLETTWLVYKERFVTAFQ